MLWPQWLMRNDLGRVKVGECLNVALLIWAWGRGGERRRGPAVAVTRLLRALLAAWRVWHCITPLQSGNWATLITSQTSIRTWEQWVGWLLVIETVGAKIIETRWSPFDLEIFSEIQHFIMYVCLLYTNPKPLKWFRWPQFPECTGWHPDVYAATTPHRFSASCRYKHTRAMAGAVSPVQCPVSALAMFCQQTLIAPTVRYQSHRCRHHHIYAPGAALAC